MSNSSFGQDIEPDINDICYNHPMYIGLEVNYNLVGIKTKTKSDKVEYAAPGYRMLWGTHLNNLLSFQTGMHYLGQAASSIIKGSSNTENIEGSSMEVAVLLHVPMPLGGMIVPYMKIGGEFWMARYKDTGAANVDEQLAGAHPLYGFGTDMVMSEAFSIALELEKSLNPLFTYSTASLRGKWKF